MSDPGSGDETQSPLSENHEHAPNNHASSRSAAGLLRRRRSFAMPAIALVGLVAVVLLAAIGISRLDSNKLPKPGPQDESAPAPKRPDRLSEGPVEPPEPFRSFVIDAAQSYLAGMLPRGDGRTAR
jgi:hypothetical protein